MKKFGKFLLGIFTKNIGIKILAVVLALFAVAFINIPATADENEKEQTSAVVEYCLDVEE